MPVLRIASCDIPIETRTPAELENEELEQTAYEVANAAELANEAAISFAEIPAANHFQN
jgi:2,4-dienoyl-CoA reductase-like NADH-dependent reductase (Old Yellow Enzyme family)